MSGTTLRLAFVLARRDMRNGLAGFRIFFLSLVLGVTAIAGVGSLSAAFLTGLAEQGRTLLGGDASVGIVHRPASTDERAFLLRFGRVSETASMRAMAYAMHGETAAERQLVELKAVDRTFPLFGAVSLSPAIGLAQAVQCSRRFCGAVAEQSLLDRLHLGPGGVVRIGTQNFRLTAALVREPDRISGGFSLGPHILISTFALPRTGLVQPGSLINYSYRIAFARNTSLEVFRRAAASAFPDAGWEIRTRNDAAPGLRNFIEQVTMFLTLVGMTALAVGGVGAGQSVRAFVDARRAEIATLKALGADGALIFWTFFLQVMNVACAAVAVGLALGAAIPFLVLSIFGAELPAPAHAGVYAEPLVLAAMFGVLSAVAFSLPALSRTQDIAPAALFRDNVAPVRRRGRFPFLAATAVAAAAIVGLALLFAPSPPFAAEFLGGTIAVLVLLRLLAIGLREALKRGPDFRRPALRLVRTNLTRPGAATAGVITALGVGFTLLAAVSLLDRSISSEINDSLPGSAPSFFFVDIQPSEADAFDAAIRRFKTRSQYKRTPMIRGRIVALNGIAARDAKVASDAKWALAGDHGISYSATIPEGEEVTAGAWWPANYRGATLISFDAELARGMGLKTGDAMTLNVLGREITGRIANLRDVNFRNGRQNFILVLSPGLIDKAPHSFLASVRVEPREEEALYRAITDRFPGVSTIRVKEAIAQVDALLQELAFGVRAASLVTICAGLLVLAGAIASGARARLYDTTVLKVLGATRLWLALIYALEYGFLGLVTGLLGLAAGALAASLASREILDLPFFFDLKAALLTVLGGGVVTLFFGLFGSWRALAARPARQLRTE